MALCQQRALSGGRRRAGAAPLILLLAVALAGAAAAPANESVADDTLAYAAQILLSGGNVERVGNATAGRSAEPAEAAAATAGAEAISSHSGAVRPCPGCTRERMLQQMGEAQLLDEMRRWRVESFGQQMLSRLGLSQPPQMSLVTLAAMQRSPPVLPDEVLTDAGIGVDRPSTSTTDERKHKGHFYIFAANDPLPECRSRQADLGAERSPERRSCLAFDMKSQRFLTALDTVRLELFVYYNSKNTTVSSSAPLPRVRLASGAGSDRGEVVSESVKVSSANHGQNVGSGSGEASSGGRWLHVELSQKAHSEAITRGGRLVLELTCGGSGGGETNQPARRNDTEVSCDGAVTLSRLDQRRPFIRVTFRSSPKAKRDTYRTVTCEEMERSKAQGEGAGSGGAGWPARPRTCCLETLRINFHRDLNFTFVAHPIEYDINFCRGSCVDGGPAFKRLYTHAVIAEYAAHRRPVSERFSPCCSPARMTGLSVIIAMADGVYRDAVIPNMSVAECGCA